MTVELGAAAGPPPDVEYRWDPDTDILTASIPESHDGRGMSGTVGLEGTDGAWLNVDVRAGRIICIEVAVWPDVRKVGVLQPPEGVRDVDVVVPATSTQPGLTSLEVELPMAAEADEAERTIHFRLGSARPGTTVRVARDLLLDVDPEGQVSGLWLLNVPPFPA